MNYDKQKAEALEVSIAKYQDIVDRLKGGDRLVHSHSCVNTWEVSKESILLGDRGCALCQLYLYRDDCKDCPLTAVGAKCDNEEENDPYSQFVDTLGVRGHNEGTREEQLAAAQRMLDTLISCREVE